MRKRRGDRQLSKSVQNSKKSNKLLIPIILMIGFVPLIVHMYTYNTGLSQFTWYPDSSETSTDMFFAWKMIAIITLGVVMLGVMLYRYIKKKEQFTFENSFYLLFFYALFVGMSALFSQYKHWVVCGTYELFEPVWVVFAYIVICYYTYHFVQEEKQVAVVLRWSGIGILIVTLIGVFQYFKLDFFQTSFGKHLITNPSYWSQLDKMNFTMAPGTSYTTLYNPNFLSFYFGLLIPLVACLIVAAKKPFQRILLAVVEVLAVICLKGSGSDSGWMAIVIGVVIVAGVLLSRKKKTAIAGIVGGAVCLVMLVAACVATPLGTKLSTVILGTYHMEDRFSLWDVETNDDAVILDIRGEKLSLSYETNELDGQTVISCKDEAGTELTKTRIDEANLIDQIDDAAYAGCSVQPVMINDETMGIRVVVEGTVWDFAYVQGDGYYLANTAGKLEKFENPKSADLFREDTMSSRGHIWNLTIPILGKHVFVGTGANTFLFAYPQNDYIYRSYNYMTNSYDVKAHCWYLQQWVENGMIGLLLLLGFLLWYVVQSARIYRRADLKNEFTWVGIGLFSGVLVYLVAGVANDSNVCTSPLFWGMLGLGMAVNRMIVRKENLFIKPEIAEAVESKIEKPQMQAKTSVAEAQAVKKNTAKKQSRKQRKNQKK